MLEWRQLINASSVSSQRIATKIEPPLLLNSTTVLSHLRSVVPSCIEHGRLRRNGKTTGIGDWRQQLSPANRRQLSVGLSCASSSCEVLVVDFTHLLVVGWVLIAKGNASADLVMVRLDRKSGSHFSGLVSHFSLVAGLSSLFSRELLLRYEVMHLVRAGFEGQRLRENRPANQVVLRDLLLVQHLLLGEWPIESVGCDFFLVQRQACHRDSVTRLDLALVLIELRLLLLLSGLVAVVLLSKLLKFSV